MRLIQYTIFILVFHTYSLFGRSEYKPQRADMITEKFCWTHFQEISGRDVTCFTQDSTGTFWFGIGTEILSYDGICWKQYSRIHGLPSAYLKTLVTAPDGRIYGVYEIPGVYTLTDTLWRPVMTLKPDSTTLFRALTPVGPDSFWLATNQGAVFYQKGHCTLFKQHQTVSIDPNINWESGFLSASRDWDILSVYVDRKANLWLVDMSDRNGQFIQIPEWEFNLDCNLQK